MTEAEPVALRLARALAVERGLRPGVAPEAAALAGAGHYVLSGVDGITYTLVCIVDRQSDPQARFALSADQVQAIGEACAHHGGSINAARAPVAIHIVEVNGGPPEGDQAARLAPYRRHGFFTNCAPVAWILDARAGTIWTNAVLGGRLGLRSLIERVLTAPGDAGAALQPAVFAVAGRPVVTWSLVALMAAIFLGPEQWIHVGPPLGALSPSASSLAVLGGLDGEDVFEGGEPWRMLTAALLHGSPSHLLFNGLALTMAGRFLEPLVGRAWYLAIFVLGAVGGSAMSLVVNEPGVVSVGASGAIMALLSAAFVASLRLPRGARRVSVQVALGQMLVPSLLPLAAGMTGLHIDYGAHLGGALAGIALGALLLAAWRRDEPHPRGRPLALAVTLAGLATAAVGALAVLRTIVHATLG